VDVRDLVGAKGRKAVGGYLAVWAAAVVYLAVTGADWVFPILSLAIFGIGFSAIAWFVTRGMTPAPVGFGDGRRTTPVLVGYLLIYAFVLVGVGLGLVRAWVAPGLAQELTVVAYKLLIHVGIPAALLAALGVALKPLFTGGSFDRRWWIALAVLAALQFGLLALVSPSLRQIEALELPAGLPVLAVLGAWLWVSIEAGLCEEFLFRACLQSSLAARFGSPAIAIAVVSVLFALSHWPGLYLRGDPSVDGYSTDPFQVAAFTIGTLSPAAVLFGVLWQRTRSLLLVALLHGAVDALPFTAEFAQLWK
jgi:membrane protease YdiL (CAAX protease family)